MLQSLIHKDHEDHKAIRPLSHKSMERRTVIRQGQQKRNIAKPSMKIESIPLRFRYPSFNGEYDNIRSEKRGKRNRMSRRSL
jgi:hypothetical protein